VRCRAKRIRLPVFGKSIVALQDCLEFTEKNKVEVRAYLIGTKRVEVYEATETRPDDAVAVEIHGNILCYVAPLDAWDAERCMMEAAQRHLRLKMMHRDDDGSLRFPKVSLLERKSSAGLEHVFRLSLLKRAPRRKAVTPAA
jgi:hypothetical protein